MAHAFDSARVKFPHRINHGMIVGIEDVLAIFRMPGDMDLRHAFRRDAIDVGQRVEAVILRRNVDIVYVEKNSAVGALGDFVQKFPLGHFGDVKFGVAADVLDRHGNLNEVAHLADFLRGDARRFKSVGHGQQVVRVAAIDAAPAEVVGKPGSLGALDQGFQAPQMLTIRSFRGTEVHRDAVLHHLVLFQNLIEDAQRAAAIDHEIFGYDFEPLYYRLAREDVVIVRGAQTDPDSVVRVAVKPIGRHSSLRWTMRKDDAEKYRGPYSPALNTRHRCFEIITAWDRRLEVSSRRLRIRPCPCRSSCLCSHCRSLYIRPCPCRSSDPCKRAFPSPCCLTGPTGPRNACRREGWTPGSL